MNGGQKTSFMYRHIYVLTIIKNPVVFGRVLDACSSGSVKTFGHFHEREFENLSSFTHVHVFLLSHSSTHPKRDRKPRDS